MRNSTFLALTLSAALLTGTAPAAPAKIVLLAGHPSHGPGEHEHNAGMMLLSKCLKEAEPGIDVELVKNGWPADESVFDGARALIFFMDGGGGHPAIQKNHLEILQKLADQGVGLGFIHYSVEVPKGDPGEHFRDWIGGYYETGFSTNPVYVARFQEIPEHPITRGVKPFEIQDEWYFNIRFRPEMKGVKPLLVATPPDRVRGERAPRPVQEAKGRAEVLSWCVERPDGGRGFGFTGAHFHKNWGNDNFRTFVLNAILWVAGLEVPSQGVQCHLSPEELAKNLDPKRR